MALCRRAVCYRGAIRSEKPAENISMAIPRDSLMGVKEPEVRVDGLCPVRVLGNTHMAKGCLLPPQRHLDGVVRGSTFVGAWLGKNYYVNLHMQLKSQGQWWIVSNAEPCPLPVSENHSKLAYQQYPASQGRGAVVRKQISQQDSQRRLTHYSLVASEFCYHVNMLLLMINN